MEWIDGKVVENALVGQKFRWLKIKAEREVPYKVGQYLILKVDEVKQNSYSICSLPGSETIEVLVDVGPANMSLPKGEGCRYIDGLKTGDTVSFSAPFGRFVLNEDGTETKVFVATGSGISSIFPMVWEASLERERNVSLFWGLRLVENVFWTEELNELAETRLNFSYNMVLSNPEGEWGGKIGHVTEYVHEWLAGFMKNEGVLESVSFYICGNGQMIKDVTQMLTNLGVSKEKVYWEKYFEVDDKE